MRVEESSRITKLLLTSIMRKMWDDTSTEKTTEARKSSFSWRQQTALAGGNEAECGCTGCGKVWLHWQNICITSDHYSITEQISFGLFSYANICLDTSSSAQNLGGKASWCWGEFKTLLSTYVNGRVIREFTWVVRCRSVLLYFSVQAEKVQ